MLPSFRQFVPSTNVCLWPAWALLPQCSYTNAANPAGIELVKKLRAQTGAPIGDVKKALEKADNDLKVAYDVLRKMGIAAATKKSCRPASEGLVAVAMEPGLAALVEVNCETDFVARNSEFSQLPGLIAASALDWAKGSGGVPLGSQSIPLEELQRERIFGGERVGEAVQSAAAILRENITLRQALLLTARGHVSTYVHNPVTPGAGSIGAAVSLSCATSADWVISPPPPVKELGKHLAMQVAAMQPMCVRTEQVPEAMLAEEKRILAEQAVAEGKSGPIVDRIIQGRLKRFYEEHVLLSQSFILEDKATVADVIRRVSQEVGAEVIVDAFAVLKVGAAAQGSGALH